MPAGQGSIEYIGKISLDAGELMKVLGLGAGAGGGAAAGAGGPATAGDLKQRENIQKGMTKAHKDPSFMSIFKPLVALEGLKMLVANSRVANAYLGGMGKMFSAAIDLLLLPFTPIFNLLMVGLSKLIGWLIDSGVLEWVAEGVEKLVNLFSGAWGTLKTIAGFFADIGKKIWDALPSPIRKGLEAIGEVLSKIAKFLNLKDVAQMAVAGAGVLAAGAMMPVVGGPIRAGLGAVAGGIGGLLGFGRGKAPTPTAPGVAPVPGRGMGGMGRMLGGGALMAGGMGLGMIGGQQGGAVGTASRIGGMGMMGAGAGLMVGGPMGAAVGGGIGLGVGALDQALLGGKVGKFLGMGGGGGGGGGTAGDVKNIGTQNNTFNIYVKDKEMAKEILKTADEEYTASVEAGI